MRYILKQIESRRDLKRFVQFPFRLYKGNLYWVPPLIKDEMETFLEEKNPALQHCRLKLFVVEEEGRFVGRVAALVNTLELKQNNRLRFGWLDFIDDLEVVKLLLSAVEDFASREKVQSIEGPMGFTNLDKAGMLIEGFDELGTAASLYNYPYYPVYMENLGYEKSADYIEYEATVPKEIPERIIKFTDLVIQRHNLRILELKSKAELKRYAVDLFKLINETHKKLFGFVALNENQVQVYFDKYIDLVRLDFISFIVDEEDQLVAFAISMPSLSRALQKAKGKLYPFGIIHLLSALKKNERADLMLIGVGPEWQKKGVTAPLFRSIISGFINANVKKVETNPELEDNENVHSLWKGYEMRQHKRRRIYKKLLSF